MVRFELSPRDLSTVSPAGTIRALAGRYTAYVGGGRPDSVLPGQLRHFTIASAMNLPN